jgi:hypothetical protein
VILTNKHTNKQTEDKQTKNEENPGTISPQTNICIAVLIKMSCIGFKKKILSPMTGGQLIEFHLIFSLDPIFQSNA